MDLDQTKTEFDDDITNLMAPDSGPEKGEHTRKVDHDPDPGDSETLLNQPTVEVDYAGYNTISRDTATADKTMMLFSKDDVKRKMQDDIADIPETLPEDLEQEYLSSLVVAPGRTRSDEDQVRINRNFLRDAEPFQVERLMEELKSTPDELLTGFPSLDRFLRIPLQKMSIIASRPGHGKTAFMLNMMLNMSRIYGNKHFLYYSYGEPRRDIELKLINMSGEKPFAEKKGVTGNVDRWRGEFQDLDPAAIKEKAEKEIEYKGLKNFLEVSGRFHVIDANYNIVELMDSIETFVRTLSVGAVFVDFLQAIRPDREHSTLPRLQQIHDISDKLRELGNDSTFPLIVGAQFSPGEAHSPEYDTLCPECLTDIGDSRQIASLIIGLQNYGKSEFIGSNVNPRFQSRFYNQPFKQAVKMPDIFKGKHPNSVILAKVLANRGRPRPEVELLFHKLLLRISSIKNEGKKE
jgi:hypothetical protein